MGLDEKQEIEQWARRIKASDEAAFSELFHRLYPRMVKFSWRYTRTKTTAKDIVQESFVKLWEVRSTIDPQKSLLAYLFQIVRNRSLNHLRDTPSNQPSIDDISEEVLKSELSSPEITSENNEAGKKMLQWIEALPERQREAIRLSRFEGLDHEEIAYVMDISPRTVNNHIVSALNTLRDKWSTYKSEQLS